MESVLTKQASVFYKCTCYIELTGESVRINVMDGLGLAIHSRAEQMNNVYYRGIGRHMVILLGMY